MNPNNHYSIEKGTTATGGSYGGYGTKQLCSGVYEVIYSSFAPYCGAPPNAV